MRPMNEWQPFALYETRNPYDSALARSNSNYTAPVDGQLERLLDFRAVSARARLAHSVFCAFIGSSEYPCLGAKAALNAKSYRFAVYREMATAPATAGLARDLCAFVVERPLMRTQYATFVAFFDETACADSKDFERLLWAQLQGLHDLDTSVHAYDPKVSQDPDDPRFAFSFAQSAFFVIGMHAASNRKSRRFPFPALVFNAHAQFDSLRELGLYDGFKQKVRARDFALQGSLNPNLSEFGERSEAKQYAGGPVEENWRCPFHP
jgi:FPC/CPF motif-containing protein YcgG